MTKPKITLRILYDILQTHSQRFDSMDQRSDSMESLQRTMASRLISIESKLAEHSAILNPLQERVESLHRITEKLVLRVDRFE